MKHDCFTDRQGRGPCTCKCATRAPAAGPWDWIDDIAYYVDRALLIVCAAVIVAIAYRIFH